MLYLVAPLKRQGQNSLTPSTIPNNNNNKLFLDWEEGGDRAGTEITFLLLNRSIILRAILSNSQAWLFEFN